MVTPQRYLSCQRLQRVKRVIQHPHYYARAFFDWQKSSLIQWPPMRIKNHALRALHAFPALTLAASRTGAAADCR
jgi:hypothetical protein